VKVPVAAQAAMGVRVVKRSLGTRDPRRAQVYAYVLSSRYAQAFAAQGGAGMGPQPPSVDDILASARRGDTKDFELDFDPASGALTSIRTNGTPEDNAAAMAALQVVVTHLGPSKRDPRRPSMKLADAVVLYEKTEMPGLKPNTQRQRARAFASYVKSMGASARVAELTRNFSASWARGLIVDGMSKRTCANNVSHVAQLFEMLIASGEIEKGENPVKGVVVVSKNEKDIRRSDGHQWEPFSLASLQKIYDPANFARTRTEHVRWAMVLGLYTGARVGEIAQLFLRDFAIVDGIPCVYFVADSDGQTLKTKASKRLVPLHPDLIELGVWARVERLKEEGAERFFPDMRIDSHAGTGNAVSKGFAYYLKQLEVVPRRANGRVGFHSLRKTVIQELQGSELSAERRRAFVGHEHGERDVHEEDYMRPWKATELATLFPGLTWGSWLHRDRIKALLE
jgi:integrase